MVIKARFFLRIFATHFSERSRSVGVNSGPVVHELRRAGPVAKILAYKAASGAPNEPDQGDRAQGDEGGQIKSGGEDPGGGEGAEFFMRLVRAIKIKCLVRGSGALGHRCQKVRPVLQCPPSLSVRPPPNTTENPLHNGRPNQPPSLAVFFMRLLWQLCSARSTSYTLPPYTRK